MAVYTLAHLQLTASSDIVSMHMNCISNWYPLLHDEVWVEKFSLLLGVEKEATINDIDLMEDESFCYNISLLPVDISTERATLHFLLMTFQQISFSWSSWADVFCERTVVSKQRRRGRKEKRKQREKWENERGVKCRKERVIYFNASRRTLCHWDGFGVWWRTHDQWGEWRWRWRLRERGGEERRGEQVKWEMKKESEIKSQMDGRDFDLEIVQRVKWKCRLLIHLFIT